MASTRFLDRSARVLWARIVEKKRRERRWLARLTAMAGGLALAACAFVALKGAALAAGASLPSVEGWAIWLSGPDPVAAAVGDLLRPVFAGRV